MADSEQRTDASLLKAWRAGDAAAGTRLLRRHFDALKAFFEAEKAQRVHDLIRATFETCLVSRTGLPDDVPLRDHLLAVARRKLKEDAH